MKRKGFTLVELLIVIGIICLIISVIVGAIGKKTVPARMTGQVVERKSVLDNDDNRKYHLTVRSQNGDLTDVTTDSGTYNSVVNGHWYVLVSNGYSVTEAIQTTSPVEVPVTPKGEVSY